MGLAMMRNMAGSSICLVRACLLYHLASAACSLFGVGVPVPCTITNSIIYDCISMTAVDGDTVALRWERQVCSGIISSLDLIYLLLMTVDCLLPASG